MPPSPQVRMARLTHTSFKKHILGGRIYMGPQTELGRTVHLKIRPDDLDALRAFLDDYEATLEADNA